MLIESYRFGQLEIPEEKIIAMERPILGFEGLKSFCLIEMEELSPFLWMQSIEDANVAFLVANPSTFFPDYRVEINSQEIAELEVNEPTTVETYVILTIASETQDITANLQGPVLVNVANNKGKQLVLVNSRYRVRHSISEAVERISPAVAVAEAVEELVPV